MSRIAYATTFTLVIMGLTWAIAWGMYKLLGWPLDENRAGLLLVMVYWMALDRWVVRTDREKNDEV
jgi:hypothetical protein